MIKTDFTRVTWLRILKFVHQWFIWMLRYSISLKFKFIDFPINILRCLRLLNVQYWNKLPLLYHTIEQFFAYNWIFYSQSQYVQNIFCGYVSFIPIRSYSFTFIYFKIIIIIPIEFNFFIFHNFYSRSFLFFPIHFYSILFNSIHIYSILFINI